MPISSRLADRGSAEPMITPSYMTRMRSEMVMTSSRSSEMITVAVPLSRCATRRWWMYSDAATSIPRVGWATSRTSGRPDSSRAMIAFWMLPPDRLRMGVSRLGVFTLNAATSSWQWRRMARARRNPNRLNAPLS